LIEYANIIATLLNSCITKPEIKGRLFATVNYDDLLPNRIIKIASVLTPVIEQESPDLMDIYFRILAILDKRTSPWKQTFEGQRPDFEDDSVQTKSVQGEIILRKLMRYDWGFYSGFYLRGSGKMVMRFEKEGHEGKSMEGGASNGRR
jgi:hypothetical protein